MISPAVPGEAGLVAEMVRELAEYERLGHDARATEDDVRRTLFGEAPQAEVRIARWDGEPAGFALFFHNYSTVAGRRGLYLEDLFVRPAFRGRGIGKALVIGLAREAVARGCARMEWAVLDWNAPAIRFYESLGAIPLADWTVYRLAGDALSRLVGQRR